MSRSTTLQGVGGRHSARKRSMRSTSPSPAAIGAPALRTPSSNRAVFPAIPPHCRRGRVAYRHVSVYQGALTAPLIRIKSDGPRIQSRASRSSFSAIRVNSATMAASLRWLSASAWRSARSAAWRDKLRSWEAISIDMAMTLRSCGRIHRPRFAIVDPDQTAPGQDTRWGGLADSAISHSDATDGPTARRAAADATAFIADRVETYGRSPWRGPVPIAPLVLRDRQAGPAARHSRQTLTPDTLR